MDKDEDLLNAIDAAEATAYGSEDNSDLARERANAIDMYLGRNVDPAPEGRSQAISRDVYDTISWIKPSLLRIFASGDDVVKVEPLGPDDEAAADQESAYLNLLILNKNPWEQICRDWFTDALLTKNAYCLAYWDKSYRMEKEKYERQSEDSLALLLQDKEVEVMKHSEYPDQDSPPQPVIDPRSGQPFIDAATGQPHMQQPMLHDVEIKRSVQEGKLSLLVLPPERCKVSEQTPDFQLLDCDYFEYWEYKTISYIRSMGFKIDDDIADDSKGSDVAGAEEAARDRYAENVMMKDIGQFDPTMRKVRLRMVWVRYDYDGDGVAELQYCLIVGREVLYREDCNGIPVASIVADPLPHRHIGLSVHDLVSDIQEVKTAILRQGLDNLYLSNNARTFVSDKINLDDMLVSTPGGIIRGATGAVFGHDIAPIPTEFIFPQAMEGMQYLDSIRQNRTGTSDYFTGVDQNALNKTAHGIAQLTSSAAQRVEDIGRIFAIGVKTLFTICHEIILKHGRKADTVKLRGQWVSVDPSTWKKRSDFSLSVGLGTGNREQVMNNLMMILQKQMETFQIGVANPENVYNAVSELCKAAGFASSTKFFTDPAKNPPPQPPPDPKVVLEQQKLQLDAHDKAGRLALDHEKLMIEKAKAISEDHLQRHGMSHDHSMQASQAMNEQNRLQADHSVKDRGMALQEKAANSESEKDDDEKKVLMQVEDKLTSAISQISQIGASLEAAAKALIDASQSMSGPKEVIRDKSGKITGIRPSKALN